jgi:hypothetical protein
LRLIIRVLLLLLVQKNSVGGLRVVGGKALLWNMGVSTRLHGHRANREHHAAPHSPLPLRRKAWLAKSPGQGE